jgi:biotin carboxyl carrier protein
MVLRSALFLFKWLVTLGVLLALFWGAYEVHQKLRATDAEKANAPPRASEKTSDRSLKFPEAAAQGHGLKYAAAEEAEWREQAVVYGRVVANPAATVTVQSPLAGTLRGDGYWPVPGQRVRAGQLLGQVEIRVSRLEQFDLQSKLADALVKRKRAEEIRDRRQELVKRQAQASAGAVTQLQREEAEVQLAEAESQVDSARAAAALLQKALDEIEQRKASGTPSPGSSSWALPLTAPTDGEVTEVGNQPDTAVEAGGLVVRIVDFRRCRVRLDLPPSLLTAGPPAALDLVALAPPGPALAGPTNQLTVAALSPAVSARLLGPAPDVDAASQFARYWYSVGFRKQDMEGIQPELREGVLWRPGLFVKSYVSAPQATAQPAVKVPASAVLFHQGRALVYVHTQPGRFQRREARILGRQRDHYFLVPRDIVFGDEKVGVDAGEQIVSEQAQILLSEEFRSEIDND